MKRSVSALFPSDPIPGGGHAMTDDPPMPGQRSTTTTSPAGCNPSGSHGSMNVSFDLPRRRSVLSPAKDTEPAYGDGCAVHRVRTAGDNSTGMSVMERVWTPSTETTIANELRRINVNVRFVRALQVHFGRIHDL